MKNIFNNSFKIIFFLHILICIINSQTIKLVDGAYSETITIENEYKFLVEVEKEKDLPYLKVKVEGIDKNSDVNHVISYYQDDSNYKERKQLSQGFTKTTVMWLTKKQVEKDFYLSVECGIYPCSFKLDFAKYDNIELELDEQYTYYVTKENKDMTFLFLENDNLEIENKEEYIMSIWAKGAKSITTDLKGGKYEQGCLSHKEYYRVNLADYYNASSYTLMITGTEGDLINVGSFLFKQNKNESETTLIRDLKFEVNGIEITGCLKAHETTTFVLAKESANKNIEIPYDLDNNVFIEPLEIEEESLSYTLDNIKDQDIFYSYQFKNYIQYEQGKNKDIPQLISSFFIKAIIQGEVVGIFPRNQEDFKYLTYGIYNLLKEQDISASIAKCNNYPLCQLDKSSVRENAEKISKNKFSFYTFNKTEWGNITPISKNQNILLISCHKGFNIDINHPTCLILENIETDNDKVKIKDDLNERFFPIYKYILKDNENKYFFEQKSSNIYLNIELISGDIQITIDPKTEPLVKNNKKLYILDSGKDYTVTIKAKENSYYFFGDIYPSFFSDNMRMFSGSNYFLNSNDIDIVPYDFNNYQFAKNYFFGIYPIDCDISLSIKKESDNEGQTQSIEKGKFYQDVESTLDTTYHLTCKDPEKCYYYISFFNLDEKNGITLPHNQPQSFEFNSKIKMLQFSYVHIRDDYDVKISFNYKNNVDFKIKFYIDEQEFKDLTIDREKSFTINASTFREKCKNFKYMCNLFFSVQAPNDIEKQLLQITIDTIKEEKPPEKESDAPKKDDDDDDDDDDNTALYVVIVLLSVVLMVCMILGAFFFQKYKKNKDLLENINATSFSEGKRNEDDDNETNLLHN